MATFFRINAIIVTRVHCRFVQLLGEVWNGVKAVCILRVNTVVTAW